MVQLSLLLVNWQFRPLFAQCRGRWDLAVSRLMYARQDIVIFALATAGQPGSSTAVACCNCLRWPVAAHNFAMFCFACADLLSPMHGS